MNSKVCKHVGCTEKFKFDAQLYRHMAKCHHPPPVKIALYFYLVILLSSLSMKLNFTAIAFIMS